MLEGKKTYIGIAVMILGFIGAKYDLGLTEEATQTLAANVVYVVGSIVAIFGRLNAKPEK